MDVFRRHLPPLRNGAAGHAERGGDPRGEARPLMEVAWRLL
jgi:hypothetical protein